MAVYQNMADFHATLDVEEIKCRGDFLWKVKWAKLVNTSPHPNTEALKGMLFAMHIGILPHSHACVTCGKEYNLVYRRDRGVWEWSQQGGECRQCFRTRRSLTSGTVLEHVRAKNWLNFFDAYCMWTLDYPRKLMEQEVKVQHQAWLLWEKQWYAPPQVSQSSAACQEASCGLQEVRCILQEASCPPRREEKACCSAQDRDEAHPQATSCCPQHFEAPGQIRSHEAARHPQLHQLLQQV